MHLVHYYKSAHILVFSYMSGEVTNICNEQILVCYGDPFPFQGNGYTCKLHRLSCHRRLKD
jgi:hypothetical protein